METRPTHKSLKKEALEIPSVKKAYDELREEFIFIKKSIRAHKTPRKSGCL